MTNKFYRMMYKYLHIYKLKNISFRYFKKASLKKYNDSLKTLKFESKNFTEEDYMFLGIEKFY